MGTDNIRLAMSCYLSKLRDVYTGVYYTVFLLLLMSEIFHNRKLKKKKLVCPSYWPNYLPSNLHLTPLDKIPRSSAVTQVLKGFLWNRQKAQVLKWGFQVLRGKDSPVCKTVSGPQMEPEVTDRQMLNPATWRKSPAICYKAAYYSWKNTRHGVDLTCCMTGAKSFTSLGLGFLTCKLGIMTHKTFLIWFLAHIC